MTIAHKTLIVLLDERRNAKPVEIDMAGLHTSVARRAGRLPAIYCLWAADFRCLYVGQTTVHPLARIPGHRSKTWWPEVVRANYVTCPRNLLDPLEQQLAWDFRALHNYPTTGWDWINRGPRPKQAWKRHPMRQRR